MSRSMPEQGLIPLHSIITAVNQLLRLGLSPECLLQDTDISAAQLTTDRNCRQILPFAELLQIYRNALNKCPEPGLGLKVGKYCGVGVYGPVGFAMLCSSTDIDAVNIAIKYQRAILGSEVGIALRVEGELGLIRVNERLPKGPLQVFYLEQFVAGFLRFNELLAERPSQVCEIRLPYADPGYPHLYDQAFGCPVRFNCANTEIVFRTDILGLALPNADPVTARACEHICDELLSQFEQLGNVAAQVRQRLHAQWQQQPSMADIAAQLGCDARTLRRHLEQEGSSFRDIKDQLRRELAIGKLRSSDIGIGELARELGFGSQASFRRAFQKWTGRQPGYYRSG